jgi:S1-C subfamily serine protease
MEVYNVKHACNARVRRIASTIAILVSASAALMIGPPSVSPVIAAGLKDDPDLPNLVATLLPSVVNVTTTRYKQVPPGNSVMAQVAEPDRSTWYGSGFIVSDGLRPLRCCTGFTLTV